MDNTPSRPAFLLLLAFVEYFITATEKKKKDTTEHILVQEKRGWGMSG